LKRIFSFLVLTLLALPAPDAASADPDTTLASIAIGSPVYSLYDEYPGLYSHRLMLGEILYEACNQNTLDVFTFIEEPWSRGQVTKIWVRRAPVGVCRDAGGSLPDVQRTAVTSRALAIGDPESRVHEIYGEPKHRTSDRLQQTLVYEFPSGDRNIVNVSLEVDIADAKVKGFMLSGDVAGARKPK
jgi:hypothetical protein